MDKYQGLPYHPTMEKVVNILRKKTQNTNPMFFRLTTSYFFCKIASMMRTFVALSDSQLLPVNMYGINLAPSGSGKGHSIAVIEEDIINTFRSRFLAETFPQIAEKRLNVLANRRAVRDQTDPDMEMERAKLEFEEQGALLFGFDSGTSAAIKQMRTKLLMAGAGSMNLEIDEIGSNMTGNTEVLNAYLELFDAGRIKQKLVKNTRENIRSEDLFGCTPTNMLLFGTPTKLLNGSRTEDEFYEMLDIGYARRCFFGASRYRQAQQGQTAQDMYDLYHNTSIQKYLDQLSTKFGLLADASNFNKTLCMKQNVLLELYEYRIACQHYADSLSEYDEIRKSEISHRYFKVAKLAAAYAYIDQASFISKDHLHNSIAMAEMSGKAFEQILKRDRPHVKLANYICNIGKELTQPDLIEELPFYKGSEQHKREMLTLAIAHGYKQGMYITSEMNDGIQFLSGKTVPATDLNRIIVAYGSKLAEGYRSEYAPFDQLDKLVTSPGLHWVSHHLEKGYRDEKHVKPGANVVVLDIEDSIDIPTARFLLKDYTYLLHTTKRHTEEKHRFRVILPLTHHVILDEHDFKEFMRNIFDWLPFEVDKQTGQRARKWMTFKGKHWYNKGELLDTLQFVPKTKKADDRKQLIAGQTNLNNLERWFINNTGQGNRNHKLCAYAFALIDMGYNVEDITNKVKALNSKLDEPISEDEIMSTIIVSVTKRVHTKE